MKKERKHHSRLKKGEVSGLFGMLLCRRGRLTA
jgi:hypothetical protein